MTYQITTQKELRQQFWIHNPQLTRVPGKTQNQYPADTRIAWCEYVDAAVRDGRISDALANRATL